MHKVDGQLLNVNEAKPLALIGRSLTEAPYVSVKSSIAAKNYVCLFGAETTRGFNADRLYGAGVFIEFPAEWSTGELWELFRMQIVASTFDDHLLPMPVVGRGPATVSTADTGNQLPTFQYIDVPLFGEGGHTLQFNRLLKVKSARGTDDDRPICFGLVIYNDHTSIINAGYHYSITAYRNEEADISQALNMGHV